MRTQGKVFLSATERSNTLTWTFATQEEADRLEDMTRDFIASKVRVDQKTGKLSLRE